MNSTNDKPRPLVAEEEADKIPRNVLIWLNTGTDSAPIWNPFGRRTTDSSIEYDWSDDSSQDILGNTWTTMKKPVMTQSFDPWDLDGGDAAQQKIYQLAVIEQNAQALTNMDVMIAHFYSGSKEAAFAERYSSCMVKPSSLGGEGGGNLGMPNREAPGQLCQEGGGYDRPCRSLLPGQAA